MADYDKSIRPGDMIDPSTILASSPGQCFVCKTSTYCIDINYQAYYCDSTACNKVIEDELRALAARRDCLTCGNKAQWIECPTGGWWAHLIHPEDGHDVSTEVAMAPIT